MMKASQGSIATATATVTASERKKPSRRASSLLRRLLSSVSSPQSQRTVQTASVTSQDYDDEDEDDFCSSSTNRNVTIVSQLPSEVEIVSTLYLEQEAFNQNWVEDEQDLQEEQEEPMTPANTASGHYERAVQCAGNQDFEQSLQHVEAGLQLLQDKDDKELTGTMLQLQAQVLGQMGRFAQSLELYTGLLERWHNDQRHDKAELANLYYACGHLSVHLGQYEQALDYYQHELRVTQSVVAHHATIARIYHEMARVCKLGLQDSNRALEYHQQAFQLEQEHYKQAIRATRTCQNCTSTPCKQHEHTIKEVRGMMLESRRGMGRIYFEQGDFERGVQLSIRRF